METKSRVPHCVALLFCCALCCIPASLSALDANQDGMNDEWQQRYGIAPFTGSLDHDEDGRINLVESINMSDPREQANTGLGSVFIRDVAPADGLDDWWQSRHSIASADKLADPDLDGRTNLEESIVCSNPWVADAPWSAAGTDPGSFNTGPATFTLIMPSTIPSLRYTLQESATLMPGSWGLPSVQAGQAATHWSTGAGISVVVETGGASRKFYRWLIDAPDSDGDSLDDWSELQLGSNPLLSDSDGDGFHDDEEYHYGTSPNNAADAPSLDESQEQGLVLPAITWQAATKWADNWLNTNPQSPASDWGSILAYDNMGHFYNYTYEGSEFRILLDFAGLAFPNPALDPANFFSGSNFVAGSVKGITPAATLGGTAGYAQMYHTRVYLGADQGNLAPRPFYRKALAFDEAHPYTEPQTLTRGYSNVRYERFWVDTNKRFSQKTMDLEPELVMGMVKSQNLMFVEPFVPGASSDTMVLDNVSHTAVGMPTPWLMIPQNGFQTLGVWVPSVDRVYLQAKGGGITPSQVEPLYSSGHEYTSSVVGDEGFLRIGLGNLNDQAPVMTPDAQPDLEQDYQHLLRFTVKRERELLVVIHPIGLGLPVPNQEELQHVTTPVYLPDQSTIEYYLNDIFHKQANIKVTVEVRPTEWVNWDVGLGVEIAPSDPGLHADNGKLDCFRGWGAKTYTFSAEENAIFIKEPPDVEKAIHVYHVAALPDANKRVGYFHEWTEEKYQTIGNLANLARGGIIGWAGPAASGSESPACAVFSTDHAPDPAKGNPGVLWTIAHELGHGLGRMGHSCGPLVFNSVYVNNPQYLKGSDGEMRLMTGRVGPKRGSGPVRLTKYEWDRLHTFLRFQDQ